MANYNTILYTRVAAQLDVPETQTEMPLNILVDGNEFPVYRDEFGFYIEMYTKLGKVKVRETQWAVLISSAVPAVPEVIGEHATGTYAISGTAAGDGDVGFSYDGVDYKVTPIAGQTLEETALELVSYINSAGVLYADNIGGVLNIASRLTGTQYNLTITDVSTDTNQSGIGVGLDGGVDYQAPIPAQPAIFEIYNDGDFQLVYEPETP